MYVIFVQVEMRQITLGVSSSQEIASFISWANDHVIVMRKDTGQKWLSFDIENLILDKDDLDLYTQFQKQFKRGDDIPDTKVRTKRLATNDSSGEQKPCTLIFGDGITWLGSVKFPFEAALTKTGEEIKYDESDPNSPPAIDLKVIKLEANHPIFIFLQDFSAYCGSGIIEDVGKLSLFLLNVYEITVLFPRQIELQSLFVAAGGKFKRTGLETLSYIILGGIQNKLVSTADNGWYKTLDKMCKEFRLYMVADVRVGFCLGVVLFTCLIRATFPDPDVACFSLNMSQSKLVSYFTDMFIYGLNGTKVKSPEEIPFCLDRAALFDKLRPEYLSDKNQPDKIDLILKICSVPTPTIVFGGGRLLHQSRYDFLYRQYPLIQELGTPSKPEIWFNFDKLGPHLRYKFESYVIFGRNLNLLQQTALPPCFDPGLLPSPLYLRRVTKFVQLVVENPDTLLRPSLSYHAGKAGISLSQLVYEACACEPNLVPTIVFWIENQDLSHKRMEWWVNRVALFDKLRIMYQNIKGSECIDAVNMRAISEGKKNDALSKELEAYRNVEREARLLLAMRSFLPNNDTDFSSTDLHANLYSAIPGTNKLRNFQRKQEIKRLNQVKRRGRGGLRGRLGGTRRAGESRRSINVFDRLGFSNNSGNKEI